MDARPETTRPAIFAAILGAMVGVGGLVWQASTLRIELDRASFVFAAVVAFGVVLGAPRIVWRSTAALLLGCTFAVTAAYAALDVLPLTPAGRGVGLAVGAFFTALIVVLPWMRLPYGITAVGFGVGMAAFELAPVSTGVSVADLVATASAAGVALIVGAALAILWLAVDRRLRRESADEHADGLPSVEITTREQHRVDAGR